MKKKSIISAATLTFLLVASQASAAVGTELPIDAGGSTVPDVVELAPSTNVNEAITNQAEVEATEPVTSNDGTALPLDQSNTQTTEVDTGQVINNTEPEVVAPEQDTVVLTEKVEPLPQTGIEDGNLLIVVVMALLGSAFLLINKFRKPVQN